MDPRPAATVILARPAPRGGAGGWSPEPKDAVDPRASTPPTDRAVEVLALRRAGTAAFLPGFVVFPGGAIDRADDELAARLFGDPHEAARACALRELYEEAGVLLTSSGPVSRPPDGPMSSMRFDPPTPAALPEVARWVAPESLEVRFDARFYATGAPEDLEPTPDGSEIEAAWWARPLDLLEAATRGDAPLMWPTRVTLEALGRCTTVADVLSLRVDQVPPPR